MYTFGADQRQKIKLVDVVSYAIKCKQFDFVKKLTELENFNLKEIHLLYFFHLSIGEREDWGFFDWMFNKLNFDINAYPRIFTCLLT